MKTPYIYLCFHAGMPCICCSGIHKEQQSSFSLHNLPVFKSCKGYCSAYNTTSLLSQHAPLTRYSTNSMSPKNYKCQVTRQCSIWASNHVPIGAFQEGKNQRKYWRIIKTSYSTYAKAIHNRKEHVHKACAMYQKRSMQCVTY